MAGNYFIDYQSDRLDDTYATDAELASGLGQKVNTSTYNTAINTLTTNINSKANANDVYTKTLIDTKMSEKADSSAVYTKGEMDTSLNLKADASVLDLKSDKLTTYTKTETNSLLSNKANVDDVYNKTSIDTKMTEKADTSTTYTKTQVDTALSGKASAESVYTKSQIDTQMGDRYTKAEVDLEMANRYTKAEVDLEMANRYTKAEVDLEMGDRYTKTDADTKFATQTELGNYALESDIPTLAGGYSSSAVDNLLALKADKSELVFRETGELDANGNPVKDPNYSLSQAELGAKLKAMDDTTNGKQVAGDYITRAEANEGDATATLDGAAAGGLIGAASVVWSGVLDSGETATRTAGDVFKEIGNLFKSKSSGGGSSAPSIDFNSYVVKPTDWVYEGLFGDDTLKSYSERKARTPSFIDTNSLQIKSSSVFLKPGLLDTPRTGYKLDVGGSVYVDGELNAQTITCPNINGRASDVKTLKLKNDLDDPFFKASHDGNLLRFTKHDSSIDVNENIGTAEAPVYNTEQKVGDDLMTLNLVSGEVKIPGALQVSGAIQATGGVFNAQNVGYMTSSNTDDLIDARILSDGLVNETFLTQNHYTKTETDNLIPDITNFETSTQLDTRFTDFRTASDAVYQPIALPENPYVRQSTMDIELAGKASAPPDGDSYALTSSLGSYATTADLANYDTSTQVDTKLSSYDTSTQVDTKLSSYDTSAQVDTKLSSYDTSTIVNTKIAGALLDYDTGAEVDTKITNAGVGSYWTKDATTNELSYGAGRVKITTIGEGLVVRPDASNTDARINLVGGGGDADAYIGLHALNTNSTHGRTVYIGAKAGDTATNSVETDLHFKVRGDSPYLWDDMVSDMVIKGDGNIGIGTTVAENKLTIEGGGIQINSWNDAGDDGKYAIYSWDDVLNINPRNTTGGFRQHGFSMTKDGNVGINTTTPLARLDVNGWVKGGNGFTAQAPLHISDRFNDSTNGAGNGKARFMMNVNAPGISYHGNEYGLEIGVSGSGNSVLQSIGYDHLAGTTSAAYNIGLQPFGGNVGIGTYSPSSKLHINDGGIQIDWVSKTMRIDEQHIYSKSGNYGTGFKLRDVDIHPINGDGNSTDGVCDFGTGSFRWRRYAGTYADIFTSDDRVKHNEEEVHNALETINKLKLYKYDKTAKMLDADYQGDLSDVDHLKEVGFIAQDVLDIPELAHLVVVPEDVETTAYGLDYQGIHNYLVQAVQELHSHLLAEIARNDALEARLVALEEKINVA